MKQPRERKVTDEPVGIVIASEVRGEVTPRFAAFMWAPAPDEASAAEAAAEAKAA